jgi:UDP-glucose 4-epimerase
MNQENKNLLILVTGATGAIGPRVVNALHDAGCRIRTFSIDTPAPDIFPADVEVVCGDIGNKEDVHSLMKGVDVVIHMAALLHIISPTVEMNEKYERINIGGTANVIDGAFKADIKRVVLFSTIAVYGKSFGRVLNEHSPVNPETSYAKTKLEAEKIVLSAKRKDGRPLGTVLRLGAVYGSRIKGNYELMTHALEKNRFIPLGNGKNRRTLVYDRDVGNAAYLAASNPSLGGRVFNVTDGEFHTINDIIESICLALCRKPPYLSLPVGPIRLLLGIMEKAFRAIGSNCPVTQAMIDKYTEDIAVDGSLFQKESGFSPQYSIKAGWEETIKEMRAGDIL